MKDYTKLEIRDGNRQKKCRRNPTFSAFAPQLQGLTSEAFTAIFPVEIPLGYERFVPIASTKNASMDALVRSILRSAGIRFFIERRGSLGYGAEFQASTAYSVVLVEPQRVEEARRLLAEMERSETDDA